MFIVRGYNGSDELGVIVGVSVEVIDGVIDRVGVLVGVLVLVGVGVIQGFNSEII
jgi:hypothetical protein